MTKTGKAWVMESAGKMEIKEFFYPELKDDGIIIRIEASGVCGTDKHMFNGVAGTAKFPLVPGHEMMGVVDAIGPKYKNSINLVGTTDLNVGDRVVLAPGTKACGRCPVCLRYPDKPYLCTNRFIYGFSSCADKPHFLGGFSQYAYAVPNSFIFKIPEGLSNTMAAMAEPVTVALRAVQRAYEPGNPMLGNGLGVGRTAMVLGAGPIGLLIVAVLKHVGTGNIIVSDRIPQRLAMAKEQGADVCIDASLSLEERKKLVMECNNGELPDVVIEAAGAPICFYEAIELVRRGGIVIESGHYTDNGTIEIHPFTVCNKDCDIRGAWAVHPILFRDALNFLSRAKTPVEKVATHVFSFEQAKDAINTSGGPEVGKVIIAPWK